MSKESLTIVDQNGSQPDCRVLALQGPLVLTSFFEFQAMVRADKSHFLIIDMSNVPYVDSAGIGALVGAYVSRQNSKRRLALVGVCPRVHDALQVTRVEQLFLFYHSVAVAEQVPA